MANKNLFRTLAGALLPKTDTFNSEGAPAYRFTPKHALAQYAATGCLNSTFYASANEQLDMVLKLANQVDASFIARTAVWARREGYMKDIPALLCAVLAVRDGTLLEKIFPQVIDNGRMLRTFVQILRSGVAGRKSLGSRPRRLVRKWFESRSDEQVFRNSIGQSPSLADIVKMVHPRPSTPEREALFAWLIGKPYQAEHLPELVRQFEAYKADRSVSLPDVPFEMLTALDLSQDHWRAIALQAPWQMTRMNLNTFVRHGVFADGGSVEVLYRIVGPEAWSKLRVAKMKPDQLLTRIVAQRLRDPEQIRRSRVLPYQLLMAWKMAAQVPGAIRDALHDALEIATANVPALQGKVYVCPDVSGSMSSPVTGYRNGSTSAVQCVDVAALVAASILRRNPDAEVIPFEQHVVSLRLDPRDSVMTNAERLAGVGGGGTNCSAPLRQLNRRGAKGDLVVFISDNESWVDARPGGRSTAMLEAWNEFRRRNPQARLVCLDIQPYDHTQAPNRADILNIGGFSDQVFRVISSFAAGELEDGHWVREIEKVDLSAA